MPERVTQRAHYLFVCTNVRPEGNPRPSCGRSGSGAMLEALKLELQRQGLSKTFARACSCSCLDMCDEGPVVAVQPDGVFYGRLTPDWVPRIVQALKDGQRLPEIAIETASSANDEQER